MRKKKVLFKKTLSIALAAIMMAQSMPATAYGFIQADSSSVIEEPIIDLDKSSPSNATPGNADTPSSENNKRVTRAVDAKSYDTIYIKSGGKGDGLSADTPMESLKSALDKVNDNGEIVVVDNCTADRVPIAINKNVTIKGLNSNSELNFSEKLLLNKNLRFSEISLVFLAAGNTMETEARSIFVNGNTLEMNNVKIDGGNGSQVPVIYAGGNNSDPQKSSNIILNSGNYAAIYLGSKGADFTGDISIEISDQAKIITNFVNAGGILSSGQVTGSVDISLNGESARGFKNLDGGTATQGSSLSLNNFTTGAIEVLSLKNFTNVNLNNAILSDIQTFKSFENIENMTVGSGSKLDLCKTLNLNGNFIGGGTVVLDNHASAMLRVNGTVENETKLEFKSKNTPPSGICVQAGTGSTGNFTYEGVFDDSEYQCIKDNSGSTVNWQIRSSQLILKRAELQGASSVDVATENQEKREYYVQSISSNDKYFVSEFDFEIISDRKNEISIVTLPFARVRLDPNQNMVYPITFTLKATSRVNPAIVTQKEITFTKSEDKLLPPTNVKWSGTTATWTGSPDTSFHSAELFENDGSGWKSVGESGIIMQSNSHDFSHSFDLSSKAYKFTVTATNGLSNTQLSDPIESDVIGKLQTPTVSITGTAGITGTAEMGGTLTVTANITNPDPGTTSYQWMRAGNPIQGETSNTYQITAPDIGTEIKVKVTTSKTTGELLTNSVTATKATPVITQKPTASTAAQYEALLSTVILNGGTVSNPNNGQPVAGTWNWETPDVVLTTSGTYSAVFTPDDSKSYSAPDKAAVQVTVNTKPVPQIQGTVTITGKAEMGANFTAAANITTPNPGALSYQWKRNESEIAGAVHNIYQIQSEDIGQRITVQVTGSNTKGSLISTEQRPNKATPQITAPTAPGLVMTGTKLSAVKLSGGLAVNPNNQSEVSGRWEWVQPDHVLTVTGNHQAIFKPNESDAYHTPQSAVEVRVSSVPVPELKGLISISGTWEMGATLTAVTKISTENHGSLIYEWQRAGISLPGAVTDTYQITADDIGKPITVKVFAENATGELISAAQTPVKAMPVITADPSVPTAVAAKTPLSAVALSGGSVKNPHSQAEVPGQWQWVTPDITVSETGLYHAVFIPQESQAYHNPPQIAVTITVKPQKPDGGSSGGGSSSGGGGGGGGSYKPGNSTSAQTTSNVSVPKIASVAVEAQESSITLNEGQISSAIASAQAGNSQESVVVQINVTAPNPLNDLTVNFPQTVQNQLVSAKVAGFSVNSQHAELKFDQNAIHHMKNTAGGDIQISSRKVNLGTLSQSAQAMIKSRPAYDFTVVYDNANKQISEFGGGKITVSIPYQRNKVNAAGDFDPNGTMENSGNLYAVYVDTQGNPTYLNHSSYDENQGRLIFETNHLSQYAVAYKQTPVFPDSNSHWAKEDIDFVIGRGLMLGTSPESFEPDKVISKGEFITALGKLAGMPSDAEEGQQLTPHTPYTKWAVQKGLFKGEGGAGFDVNAAMTRQEMAMYFYEYVNAIGFKLPNARDYINFSDQSSMGMTTRQAVKATQQAGIINAKSAKQFEPSAQVTRAQAAAALHRYVEIRLDSTLAQGWDRNDNGEYIFYNNGKLMVGDATIANVPYHFTSDGVLTN